MLLALMIPSEKDGSEPSVDQDAELVQRAREAPEGDLRAFEQLIRRHQGKVVANCRHITRDSNNADDLAQEVMVKAFFGLRRFEGKSSFRSWLQRIKINHCLNHLKKQEGRSHIHLEESEADEIEQMQIPAESHKRLEAASEREQIARILDGMSETLRIPLVLCDMDELSYEEVAQTLGISMSAAKMRIKRAREEFRKRYESQRPQNVEANRA